MPKKTYKARLKPHAGRHICVRDAGKSVKVVEPGETCELTAAEARSFGDKFDGLPGEATQAAVPPGRARANEENARNREREAKEAGRKPAGSVAGVGGSAGAAGSG